MTIRLKGVSVIVINIYKLIDNKKIITIGRFIKSALDKIKKEIILFKDFNANYYALESRAVAIKTQSKYLLRKTERRILYLLIP